MQTKTFIGYDGKSYVAQSPADGSYNVRHDGRFWHILFPVIGEPAWQQVYRGRNLPQQPDIDRWVRYRPFPPQMK